MQYQNSARPSQMSSLIIVFVMHVNEKSDENFGS